MIGKLALTKSVPARIRYLMQDIVDLRASKWVNKKKSKEKLTLQTPERMNLKPNNATSNGGTAGPLGGSATSKPLIPESVWTAPILDENGQESVKSDFENAVDSGFQRVEREARVNLRETIKTLPSLARW